MTLRTLIQTLINTQHSKILFKILYSIKSNLMVSIKKIFKTNKSKIQKTLKILIRNILRKIILLGVMMECLQMHQGIYNRFRMRVELQDSD